MHDNNDREVLFILMASKEFGFAVTTIEQMAEELRDMQNDWCVATEDMQREAAA